MREVATLQTSTKEALDRAFSDIREICSGKLVEKDWFASECADPRVRIVSHLSRQDVQAHPPCPPSINPSIPRSPSPITPQPSTIPLNASNPGSPPPNGEQNEDEEHSTGSVPPRRARQEPPRKNADSVEGPREPRSKNEGKKTNKHISVAPSTSTSNDPSSGQQGDGHRNRRSNRALVQAPPPTSSTSREVQSKKVAARPRPQSPGPRSIRRQKTTAIINLPKLRTRRSINYKEQEDADEDDEDQDKGSAGEEEFDWISVIDTTIEMPQYIDKKIAVKVSELERSPVSHRGCIAITFRF